MDPPLTLPVDFAFDLFCIAFIITSGMCHMLVFSLDMIFFYLNDEACMSGDGELGRLQACLLKV